MSAAIEPWVSHNLYFVTDFCDGNNHSASDYITRDWVGHFSVRLPEQNG